MKRILIIGAGAQGGPCASILARDPEISAAVLADIDVDLANRVKEKIGSDKITPVRVDAGKIDAYVWATPGLPMLIFVTIGLIVALLFGDIVWLLVSFILG